MQHVSARISGFAKKNDTSLCFAFFAPPTFCAEIAQKKKKTLSDITKGSGIILRLLRKPPAGRLLHHWRPVAALEAPTKTSVLVVGCKQRNKKDSDSLESGWITLMVSSCSTRVQDLKKSIQFISVCYQEHWQGVMYSLT